MLCKIILIVSISWLYHCNIHYKGVVENSNVGQKFIYVSSLVLSSCVLIQKYLHVAGLEDLASTSARSQRFGLGLGVLASFIITGDNETSDKPLVATRPKLLHLSFVWLSPTLSSSVSKTGGKSVVHDRVMFVSWPTITTATDAFIADICQVSQTNQDTLIVSYC